MATDRPLASRCSGCSREFQWAAELLYPLLGGHIFCRSCLVQRIHAAFSSRAAPVQCCKRAVPHDFVRAVVAPEEDVYYSFLLGLPRGEEEKMAGNQATIKGRPLVGTSSDAETKQPVVFRQGHAVQASISTPPRYLTRSAKARNAAGQRLQHSDAVPLYKSFVPPRQSRVYCENCGIESNSSLLKALCGHDWCRSCVEAEVRRVLDVTPIAGPMPASCCGQLLPLELARQVVTSRELLSYAKKKMKHVTAAMAPNAGKRGGKRKAVAEEMAAPGSRKVNGKAPAKKAKKANAPEQKSDRTCVACSAPVAQLDKWRVGPCGHGYCLSCLTEMAKASLISRESVPIRCCLREFPMEYVEKVLTQRQFAKYKRFLAERHPSASNLRSDNEYAAVVRESHGKQCPVCGVGVIKISGCDAIRCSLGHNFCWKCMQTRCICPTGADFPERLIKNPEKMEVTLRR
jgi:hypothetical protein